MANPHAVFGLDHSSEIVFIFQSKTADSAKSIDYNRFRKMIEASPYFNKVFAFDKKIKDRLIFPHNVIVRYASGVSTALLGRNIYGGVIDEVNYMDIVDKSPRSVDGGVYDQAAQLYETITRRRSSRFQTLGYLPGVLCLVSSKRYPNQFTDQKEIEATRQIAQAGKSTIYIYDKRLWEIKPDAFSGEYFNVFIGSPTKQPYILEDGEHVADEDLNLVVKIPVEHRNDFDGDITGAIRDVAGKSVLAITPFFQNRKAVSACFGKHESIFSRDDADFKETEITILRKYFYNPTIPRAIHLDTSLSRDSTGIVMGCVSHFTEIKRGNVTEIKRGNDFEVLPVLYIDFALEYKPPRHGEVEFSTIRGLIYSLKKSGINVHWVTADSYQSTDTLQKLRQRGYFTDALSMDKDLVAY